MSDVATIEKAIKDALGRDADCYIEKDDEFRTGYKCIINYDGETREIDLFISKKVLEKGNYGLIARAIKGALREE